MWNGKNNPQRISAILTPYSFYFGSSFHLFSYNGVLFFYSTKTVNEFRNQYTGSQVKSHELLPVERPAKIPSLDQSVSNKRIK